jgi:hypothetical protein
MQSDAVERCPIFKVNEAKEKNPMGTRFGKSEMTPADTEIRATFVQLAFESPPGSPDRHELGGGEAANI